MGNNFHVYFLIQLITDKHYSALQVPQSKEKDKINRLYANFFFPLWHTFVLTYSFILRLFIQWSRYSDLTVEWREPCYCKRWLVWVQRVKIKNHFFEGPLVQSLNPTFHVVVLKVTALETSPHNVSVLHYLQIYLLFLLLIMLLSQAFDLLRGDLGKWTSLQRWRAQIESLSSFWSTFHK